jgi:DNA-binding MarR family transcriptional regulator
VLDKTIDLVRPPNLNDYSNLLKDISLGMMPKEIRRKRKLSSSNLSAKLKYLKDHGLIRKVDGSRARELTAEGRNKLGFLAPKKQKVVPPQSPPSHSSTTAKSNSKQQSRHQLASNNEETELRFLVSELLSAEKPSLTYEQRKRGIDTWVGVICTRPKNERSKALENLMQRYINALKEGKIGARQQQDLPMAPLKTPAKANKPRPGTMGVDYFK